jgi:acyl-CoA synthetase (AMP-forming)/AMP-acid ligase II
MPAFFDYLRYQALNQPSVPAVVYPRGIVDYQRLARGSLNASTHIAAQFRPGDIVVLRVNNPELHVSVLIGAMLAGVATVSLGSQGARGDDLSAAALLYDEKRESQWANAVQISPSWTREPRPGAKSMPGPPPTETVARIIYTSGTTGAQKAVPFTEEQLLQRVWPQAVALRPQLGPSRSFSLMGIMSGAGFTNFMLTLMTGGTLFLGWDSLRAAASLALYDLDRMMASTLQMAHFVRESRDRHLRFPSLKSVVVGGSRIPAQLARHVQSEICRNLICLYGATEVGVVAAASADELLKHESAAGFIIPGVAIEAVDADGNTVGTGKEGHLRIRVPYAASRYANDAVAGKTAFRDGWFYPGDIGRIGNDGLLFVAGRESERLNAGGVKIAPGVIEDAVQGWPNVADAAAFEHLNEFGVGEIAVAIVRDGELDQPGLAKYCRERLRECAPKRLLLVNEIPRNETGKVNREQLQRLAQTAFAKQSVAAKQPQA